MHVWDLRAVLVRVTKHSTLINLILMLLVAVFFAALLSITYNIFLHPLRGFPGPRWAAATNFPFAWRVLNGRMVNWTTNLHRKYGQVVRIHPNELSFVGQDAWQDIFGCRPELRKPDVGTIRHPNGVRHLPLIVDIREHARQRRILNHAFSDRALQAQEPLIQKHVDNLIRCLTEWKRQANGILETDICKWYHFVVFDIMGDLCFSENFDTVENSANRHWLQAIHKSVRTGRMLTAFDHFPPMGTAIRWIAGFTVKNRAQILFDWTRQMTNRRFVKPGKRPDFLRYILENNGKGGLTKEEIDSTMHLLVRTGSGATTAAVMTAMTFFVLKHPGIFERLKEEIRSAVGNNSENLTIILVSRLEYLDAVLQESIRMHPPVPASNPRVVDRPGVHVCGILIPQGARVGIPQQAAYRLEGNFVDPQAFRPERWLPDPQGRFSADQKGVFEPFMVGPRRCIARGLALAEIKLIIAKVLWHFDLELSEKNRGDWCDQRSYLINERKPLYINIKIRKY